MALAFTLKGANTSSQHASPAHKSGGHFKLAIPVAVCQSNTIFNSILLKWQNNRRHGMVIRIEPLGNRTELMADLTQLKNSVAFD